MLPIQPDLPINKLASIFKIHLQAINFIGFYR